MLYHIGTRKMDTLEEVDVSLLVLEYVVESVECIRASLGHSGMLNSSCSSLCASGNNFDCWGRCATKAFPDDVRYPLTNRVDEHEIILQLMNKNICMTLSIVNCQNSQRVGLSGHAEFCPSNGMSLSTWR